MLLYDKGQMNIARDVYMQVLDNILKKIKKRIFQEVPESAL